MSEHVQRLRLALTPGAGGRFPLLSVPGCWDALTALLIERAGFAAAFLSGSGLSMARLGQPDMGLVSASELVDTVAAIRDRIALPLIVDGDTGFGNSLNMARTVRSLERAGASAIQIEDQQFPKRCGHMAGKAVIPLPEAVGKVRAALNQREHMLVIARTDAAAVEGMAAAIDRAHAFLDAGADLIFVEGPPTLDDMRQLSAAFAHRVPLVHNLVEGGVSAVDDTVALRDLGYGLVLHPLMLMHAFVPVAECALSRLREAGDTRAERSGWLTLHDMNQRLGADQLIAFGENYAA